MPNTSRNDHIRNGFALGSQLDASINRLNRKPIPALWPEELRHYRTIRAIVKSIATFDASSDELVEHLCSTPIGDSDATIVAAAGLLPGLIRRNAHRPHRVANTITELSLYLAERPTFGPARRASLACLDIAEQRSRREIYRQAAYEEFAVGLPTGIQLVAIDDTEASALARVTASSVDETLQQISCGVTLDQVLELVRRRNLSQAERQMLTRRRRQLRPVLALVLAEVA